MIYHPIATVIVPFFNSGMQLKMALDSIQEVASLVNDLEIILVDDGSTDDSGLIAKDWCSKFQSSFIRIVYLETVNCGPGDARNAGLLEANGIWTLFLDADDVLIPRAVVHMLRVLKTKTGIESDVIHCNFHTTNGKFYRKHTFFPRAGCLIRGTPAFWANAYRTDFLHQKHIQFGSERMGEDLVFLCRVAANSPRVSCSKRAFYRYSLDSTNSLTGLTSEAWLALPVSLRTCSDALRGWIWNFRFLSLSVRSIFLMKKQRVTKLAADEVPIEKNLLLIDLPIWRREPLRLLLRCL